MKRTNALTKGNVTKVMFLHKNGFKAAAYAEVLAWAGALLVNFVAYQIVIKGKLRKI